MATGGRTGGRHLGVTGRRRDVVRGQVSWTRMLVGVRWPVSLAMQPSLGNLMVEQKVTIEDDGCKVVLMERIASVNFTRGRKFGSTFAVVLSTPCRELVSSTSTIDDRRDARVCRSNMNVGRLRARTGGKFPGLYLCTTYLLSLTPYRPRLT